MGIWTDGSYSDNGKISDQNTSKLVVTMTSRGLPKVKVLGEEERQWI